MENTHLQNHHIQQQQQEPKQSTRDINDVGDFDLRSNDAVTDIFKPIKRFSRRCKICRKRFQNIETLRTHVNFHRKVKKDINNVHRNYFCRLCNTSHYGLQSFLEHQKVHQARFISNDFLTIDDSTTLPIQNAGHGSNGGEQVLLRTHNGDIQLAIISSNGHLKDASGTTISPGFISNFQNVVSSNANLLPDVMPGCTIAPSNQAALPAPRQPSLTASKPNNDGLHIDVPNHVRAIYLNGDNSNINILSKQLDILNNKVDCLLKHFNLSVDKDGNLIASTGSLDINLDKSLKDEYSSSVSCNSEGYPPSYSVIQASKEQQQQEYYALTLSSRQLHHGLKGGIQIINQSPENMKISQKSTKGVELWVPSQQYLNQLATLEDQSPQHGVITQDMTSSSFIPNQLIEKVYVESRSRANFAKNLTFAIFSAEERQGKNCTGRVFGKAQLKGQLDQTKLQMVKEATFRKYPCPTEHIDMAWRKECITAIDSGLRNEHRSSRSVAIQSNNEECSRAGKNT
nr:unnamed protein product [Hydra vulgaris]